MTKTPSPWSVHQGRDPEAELRSLKKRFEKVSSRYFRRKELRRGYRFPLLVMLAAVGSFALTWAAIAYKPWTAFAGASTWSAMTMLKHIAAFPNCSAARAAGLAPAYRGQPGYWPQHDRDKDGWACEPYPRH